MFVAQPNAKTTVASVLLTLVLAILPPGAWARCLCGPDKCGVSTTESDSGASCCAAHTAKSSAKGCCAVKKSPRHEKASCCCTSPVPSSCSHSSNEHGASAASCQCSPAPFQQPPTSTTPTIAHHTIDFDAVPLVAILPPTVELTLSPSDWAASLIHAPPIPLRELYCVWRN